MLFFLSLTVLPTSGKLRPYGREDGRVFKIWPESRIGLLVGAFPSGKYFPAGRSFPCSMMGKDRSGMKLIVA